MKIAVTGSTGFVGTQLRNVFSRKGWDSVPLLRDSFSSTSVLSDLITGCDGVVNLAGAPIITRWSDSVKETLWDSRVGLTQKLVDCMNSMDNGPQWLISASAVGLYKDGKRQTVSDNNFAEGFLADLCQAWEKEALRFSGRTAIFRIGVVLGNSGGMIQKIRLPFKLGLGGKIGRGSQGFSWIHIDDLIEMLLYGMENKNISGVFNATAPKPVSNREFTRTIGRVMRRPVLFPVPSFILRILFGEGSKIMTEGQYVFPEKIIAEGFQFKYTTLESALEDIFNHKELG